MRSSSAGRAPGAFFALVVALCAVAPRAIAHESDYVYVQATIGDDAVAGHCDVSVRDVRIALGADPPTTTATEADARGIAGLEAAWAARVGDALRLVGAGGPCAMQVSADGVAVVENGSQVRTHWQAVCPGLGERLTLRSELLFDLDDAHRTLVTLHRLRTAQNALLTADAREASFDVEAVDYAREARLFVGEGVHHIWIGLDHLLFLLALLLPAVRERAATPRPLRAALLEVTRTVTAFTLAHSITLALVTLGWVSLPSRWVEAAIAASVAVAALNNLRPWFQGREWQVAFAFGLIHGFGFAGVLAELGLPEAVRALGLFAFNLGVELGQLVVVVAALPVLFALRKTALYRVGIVGVGSFAIAWLAAVWLCERLFEIELLPGL